MKTKALIFLATILSCVSLGTYASDPVANTKITASKALELGLSISVTKYSKSIEPKGEVLLINLFFSENTPCQISGVIIAVINEKETVFSISLHPVEKQNYSFNINKDFLKESALYFSCKKENENWMQYEVNIGNLVTHNKRVKFAPAGRWDLRFAAAPYPRRYAHK